MSAGYTTPFGANMMRHYSSARLWPAAVVLGVGCAGDANPRCELASQTQPIIGARPVDPPIDGTTGALYAVDGASTRFVCSGVLIAPTVVLTAAHCVDGNDRSGLVFSLGAAGEDVDAEEATPVARRAVHEDFRRLAGPDEPLNDIALLKLAEPRAEASAEVADGDVEPGAEVALVGYGATQLAEAGVSPAPAPDHTMRNVGIANVSSVSAREMTFQGDVQACSRDSGGPALLWPSRSGAAEVVGIASRALDPKQACVGGSVYTRVSAYRDWINIQRERWHPPSRKCASPE